MTEVAEIEPRTSSTNARTLATDRPHIETSVAADPRPVLPAIAFPTVLVWFGSVVLWMGATAVVLGHQGTVWLLLTIPVHVATSYAMFTVLHDSIHRAVGRPKWVNEVFGRLSLPFVGLWGTYPAVRYIHLEHHRNTNEDPRLDPDAWAHCGPRWQLPLRWLTTDAWYACFYLPRLHRRPRREVAGLLINETLLLGFFGALIGLGHGGDLLVIYLIPQRIAVGILAWWFDWLPHHDLGVTAKADAFRASRVRVGWERLMNPLMCYQNFHVVHHRNPRIPFYLWMKVWQQTQADYLDRDVPISTAWGRALTPSQYSAWRDAGRPR